MPKISIIIPVYNSEEYIYECLNSVSKQSFRDFEVIVVDDGSLDSSGKICDEFSRNDFRFSVIHIENGGVAHARNTGLSYANGEWITFVDSDDVVGTEYLYKMLALVDENTDLVLCDLLGREKKNMISMILESDAFMKHPSLLAGYPYNKLYRQEIIQKHNIYFPIGISTMEDNIFVWRYIENCRFVSISQNNSYSYNKRVNSLAHSVHNIREIYKLSASILPVYERIKSKFGFESYTIRRCDSYLFLSCLKRMLISKSNDMSMQQIKILLLETYIQYNSLILRVFKDNSYTLLDKFILYCMKRKYVNLLALFTKVYNMIKY